MRKISSMDKKIIVLTGGTSGIGIEAIHALVKDGYFVEFTYYSQSDLAKSIEIDLGNDNVASYCLDLNSKEECSYYSTYILNKHDSIYGFVHNAGITRIGHLSLQSEEDWQSVFNINILNIFPLLKDFSKKMILNKDGTILLISSIAGIQPAEGQANYAASKSALIALTKSLGKELGRFGIRVNCISPGFVNTKMVKTLSKKYLDNLRQQIPVKKFAEPEEIVNVIKFLISKQASYINCANIVVDGGLT